MRFNYERKHKDLQINLTPLIDVVFLLIIFFLVTSSFVQIKSIRVNLPVASSADAGLGQDRMLVEVDAGGQYFFDDHAMSFEALETKMATVPKEAELTISADKRVPFEAVMKVWDLARKQGLKQVVVLTA